MEYLSERLKAVMTAELDKIGEEAGLPPLEWSVDFDSVGFHGRGFDNCCTLIGRCQVVGPAGIAACQEWVTEAEVPNYWSPAQVDERGIWTAAGYAGGLDISIECIADEESFIRWQNAEIARFDKEQEELDAILESQPQVPSQ